MSVRCGGVQFAIGANIGVEADGKHDNFERPILVLRKFSKEAVLAAPITSRIKNDLHHVVYTHDEREFAVIISQIRLISTRRLLRRIFTMDSSIFEKINTSISGMIHKRPVA